METLLADTLNLFGEHLEVREIVQLGAVSRHLRQTLLAGGDELVQRCIAARIEGMGAPGLTSGGVTLMSLSEDERWIGYPRKAVFQEIVAREGGVQNLTLERVHEMGRAVARFQKDVLSSSPTEEEEEEQFDWARWCCPTYIGLRGGYVHLDFAVVEGIALVFYLRIQYEFKHQYDYAYFHGYVDDQQQLRVTMCHDKRPIQNDNEIPFSYVPYDFYTESGAMNVKEGDMTVDLVKKYDCKDQLRVAVWRSLTDEEYANDKGPMFGKAVSWLNDSSGTVFALTLGSQILRRRKISAKPRSRFGWNLQSLTTEQGSIAKKHMGQPWAPSAAWNMSQAVGFDVTKEEVVDDSDSDSQSGSDVKSDYESDSS